jgi:hypothetical protein
VIDRSGKSVLRSLRNTLQICARASHPDLKRTIRTSTAAGPAGVSNGISGGGVQLSPETRKTMMQGLVHTVVFGYK